MRGPSRSAPSVSAPAPDISRSSIHSPLAAQGTSASGGQGRRSRSGLASPDAGSAGRLIVTLISAVVVAACSPSASPSTSPAASGGTSGSFEPSGVTVNVAVAVNGFDSPLDVTNAGDGSGRLFVVEQAGRIRLVKGGALVERPFLDITGRIASGGERGLLGLAFHPDYPTDPRFFVDYTDRDGNTVVVAVHRQWRRPRPRRPR